MRFYLALWLAKLARWMIRLLSGILHKNGSDFPGVLALKICPDFLARIDRPKTIIAVTGTNGKTTTTNLIADLLEKNGTPVLSNRLGSNIHTGIASCLLSGVTLSNHTRYSVAVLEVDERSSLRIYPYVKPDYVVVTNLSRDSMKRNAHPYYNQGIISQALPDTAKLILNADDMISSYIKPDNQRVYYAVDQQPDDKDHCDNIVNDVQICPRCHSRLKFIYNRYNHIGKVYCPSCGLTSPSPKYHLTKIDSSHQEIAVQEADQTNTYPMIADSIFNLYDELAAIAFLREYGLKPEQIVSGLQDTHIVDTRMMVETVNGVKIVANLTKSMISAACSAVFDFVRHEPGEKEVILILDDIYENHHHSENISWMYDTDFEFLADPSITRIAVISVRKEDYALRLQLAGVPADKVSLCDNAEQATESLSLKKGTTVFILYDLYQLKERTAVRLSLENRLEGVQHDN